MNIFKFTLHIKSKSKNSNIKASIKDYYKNESKFKETDRYDSYCKEQWRNIDKENIQSLYTEKSVLVHAKLQGIYYYLMEFEKNDSKHQISLEVIVISNNENIHETFQYIYKDIKNKIKKSQFKIIDKKILIYIYNEKDIIRTDIMIKADIIKFNDIKSANIIRSLIFFVLSIMLTTIAIKNPNTIVATILYSISGSIFVVFLSDLVIILCRKHSIKINNFSNWIEQRDNLMPPDILSTYENTIKNPDLKE